MSNKLLAFLAENYPSLHRGGNIFMGVFVIYMADYAIAVLDGTKDLSASGVEWAIFYALLAGLYASFDKKRRLYKQSKVKNGTAK